MAIFLDCFTPGRIREISELGVVSGVTTNPKLISHETEAFSFRERICEICDIIDGPVAVEITATEKEAMVEQARELHSWKPGQVVVKVPVSMTGYAVIAQLEQKHSIPAMATCVMTFTQGYAAALAGAHYIALFWGRMREANLSPEETVMLLNERIEEEKLGSRILAASIRGVHHAAEALTAGAHVITVSPSILEQMLAHRGTDEAIREFAEDWRCARERGIMG
jgi:transaldolase